MSLRPSLLKKIRLEDLYVFKVLSDEKNFSKVAEKLNKSQGTISSEIIRLESLVKVNLIKRDSKSFNLTENGKKMLEFAEDTLNNFASLIQEYDKEVNINAEELTGTVKISSSTIPGEHILPIKLALFKKMYPNVNFSIVMKNSDQTLEDLENNIINFAFIGKKLTNKQKQIYEILNIGNDELKFVCSSEHELLRKKKKIYMKDIYQYPFVLREKGSGTRNVFENSIYYNKNDIKIGLLLNSNQSILTSLQGTNYISIMSKFTIDNLNEKYNIINIEDYKPILRKFVLLRKKKTNIGKLGQIFWEFFKEI